MSADIIRDRIDACPVCIPCDHSGVRILVVEDDKKTAAFIAKAFKAEGFAVDCLRNGDDALAAVETTPFDAVVLMRSAGRVYSRVLILEKVWDYHFDPGSNLVDVYVGKLREKIDAGSAVKLLHSVRGEGSTRSVKAAPAKHRNIRKQFAKAG